ncbi:MAG TPA: DNA recombination protein RmuC [Rhodopila sp.]|nr:DNA recombination protein RmuC [Rhodopila sp.]
MEILILVLVAAALAASVGTFAVVLRQAHALQALRLLAEQTQAGLRAENETTRNAVRAGETGGAERLAGLKGALDVGIEQIRTALSRDQGALRLALAEGQAKTVAQTGAHFETVRELLDLKLRELREGNEAKLAEIHKTVNEQLHAAVEKQMGESFNRVIDQFTAVQKAMGDVQAVTAQIGDIKRLFSNVKTRGGWGETQVRAMLDDILPPGAYETNKKVRPDSDDVVEFAVIMPMRGENRPVLPIDSKFPIEDYERLLAASEAGDVEAERGATRMLERRVREEARKIAAKYIAPPVTVEFAILYLPTDALYAEVARIPGLVDDIGRECRVLLMGPTLFPALLRTIHLGFVTLALEHKADQIRDLLGATRTEMLKMDDVLDRLAKQAGTFSATIDKARVRTRAVGRKLRGVEQIEAAQAETLLDLGGVATVADLDEMDAESIEAEPGA